jgi:GntP family gluconate:H+ symporter
MDTESAAVVAAISYWPLAVLGLSIVFVVLAIAVLRMHPFLALILGAILVGLLSDTLPGVPQVSHLVQSIELPMTEFGVAAGRIAFVILMASIIGMCMLESGAADKIVRRFMATLGEQRAGWALMASGFFLSIPVFFDTVFFLLIPLARALALRTGRNYMLYVMAICAGGVITHCLVAPTPGPLIMAETLRPTGVELGTTIVAGLLAGFPIAVLALYFIRWVGSRVVVPLREIKGASLDDLQKIVDKPEGQLPPFAVSVLPVLLPVLLIAAASFFGVAQTSLPGFVALFGGAESFAAIKNVVDFLGNKNLALLLGTAIAIYLLMRQTGVKFRQLGDAMGPPLETAGVIILITAAGGAYGAMIRHSGVGEVVKALAEGYGVNYVLLAWTVTAIIRVAQGSATVAMITGSGLMAAILGDGSSLPFHPIYIFLAVAFGSTVLSWMNDSGFWVVGKLSGFTEQETLKSWTLLTTFISVVGLIEVLIFSTLLPLR